MEEIKVPILKNGNFKESHKRIISHYLRIKNKIGSNFINFNILKFLTNRTIAEIIILLTKKRLYQEKNYIILLKNLKIITRKIMIY